MEGISIIKVIVATNVTIGAGIVGDPIRRILQLYDVQGRLILEIDPGNGDRTPLLRRYNPEVITL